MKLSIELLAGKDERQSFLSTKYSNKTGHELYLHLSIELNIHKLTYCARSDFNLNSIQSSSYLPYLLLHYIDFNRLRSQLAHVVTRNNTRAKIYNKFTVISAAQYGNNVTDVLNS